jgi:hypothetical protein
MMSEPYDLVRGGHKAANASAAGIADNDSVSQNHTAKFPVGKHCMCGSLLIDKPARMQRGAVHAVSAGLSKGLSPMRVSTSE